MAGFNSREACLFKLRAYEDKTLWEAADIMGYSLRTIDRINRDMKRIDVAIEALLEVNMGATAIGTSLNANEKYRKKVIYYLK